MHHKHRRKNLKAFIVLIVFLLLPAAAAESTILTAKKASGPIELDGHAIEEDWKHAESLVAQLQDGSIGKVDVHLKALYDSDYLYLYATWPDPTLSADKDTWRFDGENWTLSGDEDRIALVWNIDNSIAGFNIGGCAMLCHGDRMHTNSKGELADLWHWKAGRTDPLGYADDEWIDNTIVEGYTDESKEAAMNPDGAPTSDMKNIQPSRSGPKYHESRPEDETDSRFIFLEEVENGEAVEITESTRFKEGDTVPGYILQGPIANRGDVEAKGKWIGGRWQLELRRKLNTGFVNDVQFDISKTYRFGVAVMDNTGGFEAYGRGHSFALGAKTLEFGGIASEEVTRLTLVKDYLTVAESHALRDESEKAVSNIGDAIIIYNELGRDVAGLDPELYLSTKNQFMEAKRIPSVERIASLREAVDATILTLQGKRKAPEAPLRLQFLVLWGRIQLYTLVLLALISLVPIYKAIQVGRKPTFRRLSIFILVIVVPLVFEGIGRVGILLKLDPLQNFSFLTNEYATFQWAVLMFFGLFIAKSGFEEVEESMKSLEFYSAKLSMEIEKMKELEAELRESEERYRGIFEASPIGILEVKPDGSIMTCNDIASKIIDCPGGECECKSFLDFIKEPEVKKVVSTGLQKGGSVKDQFIQLIDASGHNLIVSLSLNSVLDEKGLPLRSEIVIMDVTDRIKIDEEKRRLEKELSQSERLASVGKLALGFAHEISNPLTNIQLAVELLSKKEDRKDIKHRLEVITKNVDMATSVVRNLLDFSRQTQLNITVVELEKVLLESLDMLSPRLKDVKVVKKMEKLPKIPGDPKQLQQVFSNIIINAVQAMPNGGRLTINSRLEGSLAVVSFADTGMGIHEKQLGKVFDPFFTTKEVGSGTGLGLSLTYGIVKAHGGDINIESTIGKGTTVTVRLPVERIEK